MTTSWWAMRPTWYEASVNSGYQAMQPEGPKPTTFVVYLASWAYWLLEDWNILRCNHYGHRLIGNSYDPENGHNVVECTRCGDSWSCWH